MESHGNWQNIEQLFFAINEQIVNQLFIPSLNFEQVQTNLHDYTNFIKNTRI
jgi:hypothetical protein